MKLKTIGRETAEIYIEAMKSSALNMGFDSCELEERIYNAAKAHKEHWSEGGLILLNGLKRAYKVIHTFEEYAAMMDRVKDELKDN